MVLVAKAMDRAVRTTASTDIRLMHASILIRCRLHK